MADRPFGFGPPAAGRPVSAPRIRFSRSARPAAPRMNTGGAGPLGPLGDPQQFADALRQFADLMSWQGGPVNWDLAKNLARQAVAGRGRPERPGRERRPNGRGAPAGRPLAGCRDLAPDRQQRRPAWSRAEWIEATLPVWSKDCRPGRRAGVDAMGGILPEGPGELGVGLPPEMARPSGDGGGPLLGG